MALTTKSKWEIFSLLNKADRSSFEDRHYEAVSYLTDAIRKLLEEIEDAVD